MITGLLLICVLETNECSVNVSRTFYSTIERCEVRTQELKDELNSREGLEFYVVDTKCVGWGEKI